jgi:hypothetical protein
MNSSTGRHQTHPLIMALVIIGFIVLIPLLVITFTSGDLEWFRKDFQARPYMVVVYAHGHPFEYISGTPGYDQLAEAVRASLASGASHSSGIGLSQESQEEARTKYTSVEAYFEPPVKLHASFNTGSPTRMLFLITGRHSEIPIVFLGTKSTYFSNAPYLNSIDPLRSVLAEMGYSVIESSPD